ncbi:M20/M25/M40 family metallo-hydrolase [Garciella nitratireducens]|uniref:Peptidase T-like protein n=1 Tax=Garciella nitratireducens DSM 15102 TaxID=1121911 RepID=A0A1T4MU52_9FIRM|nr:M20/M25/M40 family metallo-hydrolase [Garciella nitratireducens]SJZ70503.1 peptidase T-like protein [Garciella nitratireducens DSM 15102]
MINEKRIVKEFIKYVKIDSLTKNEKNFANFIAKELKSLGLEVFIDNAGEKVGGNTGNIIAKLQGTKDIDPILFSCHMDTVSPGKDIKPIIKEGVIYSDGTTILGADDKAGIAAVIEALKVIKEYNLEHPPIEIVFSIYEEGGLFGAKNLNYDKIISKRGIVLDSGGDLGNIIIQGPAQDKINAKIIGKSAHAGVAPEEGISAIFIAANAISRMNLLRIDEETTANIGMIQGGEATNIVTPEVYLKAEARSLSNDKLEKQTNHMIRCLQETAKEYKGQVEINTQRMYNAFQLEENEEIVNIVKNAYENMGIIPHIVSSGGGSDTNILNAKGIKSVNVSIGERNAHTLEEHISIQDLMNTARFILEVIQSLK